MILTKRRMYDLYELGAFGNKLRTWAYPPTEAGTYTMRYAGRAGGGFAAYDIGHDQIAATVSDWVGRGADAELIRFNESAPDDRLLIQGEVMDAPEGPVLRYSTRRGKMRDAMRWSVHEDGLVARMILRHLLTPSSYEDILDLLSLHPGAVVEFSAYEMTLGDCRGRNAVIWEVRNY